MKTIERDTTVTGVGYESMVWVRDESGAEFSCTAGRGHGNAKRLDELSAEERKTCMNVNQLIGTERW